jgi:hypothetical protein
VTNLDSVDARLLADAANGTQWFDYRDSEGDYRPPANLIEAGGYPVIDRGTPCLDTDHDGMPDDWEIARGLNPSLDDSAHDRNNDGYTNIEEYINGSD